MGMASGGLKGGSPVSPEDVAPLRQSPRWNVVSLLAPFLAGVGYFLLVPQPRGPNAYAGVFGGVLGSLAVGSTFGLLAALASIARRELLWGVTLTGFLMNLAILLGFLVLLQS